MSVSTDTIVAIATAAGFGGIGIVRLSGPRAREIAQQVVNISIAPRHASRVTFRDIHAAVIDDGIAIFFPAPHSYTGEDVVELQAHGNPLLLAQLQRRCHELGARAARPGEFTERAFLNDKLDLAQAEAVADLIAARSEAALRAARRSLEGEFSKRVNGLVEQLTQLRIYIEAALDFPEEEIDFLATPEVLHRQQKVIATMACLQRDALRGKRLLDGLHVVILGAPNSGKSSLLNALVAEDRAIVSNVPGTTRDLLRETVNLEGVSLTLVDTAGLRDSPDVIEAEGMRRARAELDSADLVLAVLDETDALAQQRLASQIPASVATLWVHNKIDLSGHPEHSETRTDGFHLWLSAQTGVGLEVLRHRLRAAAVGEESTGSFSARERHLEAIAEASSHLFQAMAHFSGNRPEFAAEELRLAQDCLGQITGHMDADALLERIFSGFCIGK